MQFEYDPEKLIEEIRKRPGLWDSENEHYRAKSIRCKLWMEVVHEMLESTVTLTKSEMRELELQLQKKWKCMRDSYIKYVQNPHRTKRPYIYSKYLTFLVGQISTSNQDVSKTGSDTDGEPPSRKRKTKTRRGNVLVLNKDMSEDDNDCVGDADDGLSNNSNEYKKEIPVELSMEQPQAFAFANVESRPRDDSEDCDRMFLLSMLPHLKSIPEEFRLNVKMELMQVLKSAQQSISVLPHKLF